MKEIKSAKKTHILKKILIKICRLFGYELIDQSSFEFPVSNKNYSEQISIPGKKSITLGLGETKITRKVNSLNIIIKTCTSVQLVSQNKKRIFEKEKSEYTFRTIKSLFKSSNELRKIYKDINIEFTIIDIGSTKSDLDKMLSIANLESSNIKTKLISVKEDNAIIKPNTINKNNQKIQNNMASTMLTIQESFNYVKNCNDLIYFVEDDYLHKLDSLTEMVMAFEKFSSIFNEDVFLVPTDYPYLYKKAENSIILIGDKYHWRSVDESLLTFMTSKKIVEKYFDQLMDMSVNESEPFEKNLHEIYKKQKCFSPMPSLSVHCSNINSVFGISPNIDVVKLWNDNEI